MKYIFLGVAFVLIANSSFSQAYDCNWAQASVPDALNMPKDIGADALGNSYSLGRFTDSIRIGNMLLSSAGVHAFLVKRDFNGQLIWSKILNTSNTDIGTMGIAVTPSGTLYVNGFYSSTLTIGSETISSAGGWDVFLSKLDSGGNIKWTKTAGGPGEENYYFPSIVVTPQGDVYMGGSTESQSAVFGTTTITRAASVKAIFLAKYDPNGDVIWAQSAGGGVFNDCFGIATDNIGRLYATGYVSGAASFGTTTVNTGANSTPMSFIARYSADGNIEMAKLLGSSDVLPMRIDVDVSGYSYITGQAQNGGSIGGIQITSGQPNDIFFVKCDSTGNVAWAKSLAGPGYDVPADIHVNENGSFFLTGEYSNSLAGDGFSLTPGTGNHAFLAKYETDGSLAWINQINSASGSSSGPYLCGSNETIFITGSFKGSTLVLNNIQLPGQQSKRTLYTARYGQTTGIMETEKGPESNFILLPNPVTDKLTIEFPEPLRGIERVSISDATGRIVIVQTLAPGTKDISIATGSLSPGLYNAFVSGMSAKKFIVR